MVFTEDVDHKLDDVQPVVLPTERAIDKPVKIKTRHPLFGDSKKLIAYKFIFLFYIYIFLAFQKLFLRNTN